MEAKRKSEQKEAIDHKTKFATKIEIDEIKIIGELHPRQDINEEKISEYAENLQVLPPIKINPNKILIDGFHRIKAHQRKDIKVIAYETENIPDEEVLSRAIALNATHGIQLSNKDKKRLAIKLFNGKNGKEMRKILSVQESTFNNWVKDIRQAKRKQLEDEIIQEYLKAENTIESVSETFDMPHSTIGEIVKKYPEEINLVFSDKVLKPVLKEKYDELIGFKPFSSNVWDLNKSDDPNSLWEYPSKIDFGEISNNVYENLLYYYTEPLDVVAMPDVNNDLIKACKKWYRRFSTKIEKSKLIFMEYKSENDIKDVIKNLKKDCYLVVIHKNIDKIDLHSCIEQIVLYYPIDAYKSMQSIKALGEKRMLNQYMLISIFKK
jgi:hypothetical protein